MGRPSQGLDLGSRAVSGGSPERARYESDLRRTVDRVGTLGLRAVCEKLDARFRLLTGGARATLRRHQTLRAALEWS